MLVAHSEVYKHTFSTFVKKMRREGRRCPTSKSARTIRHLRACKVRFESCTKPMGRCILYLSALLSTLIHVSLTRRGQRDAGVAEGHLQFIDNERVLTLAMLADAGDESLMLARYYDTGRHDPATALQKQDEFRMRIDFLFVRGKCFTTGFTNYALEVLRRPYTVIVRNTPKTIGGGVSDVVRKRCLQRMQCWVWLATSTIRTEFPKWDITQCLTVFNLDVGDAQGESGRNRDMHVDRLAQILRLPPECLRAELDDVLPVAFQVKSNGKGMSNMEAWRSAVNRLTDRGTAYGSLHTLRQTLIRACAWQGCSTSGVEQTFSRVDLSYLFAVYWCQTGAHSKHVHIPARMHHEHHLPLLLCC